MCMYCTSQTDRTLITAAEQYKTRKTVTVILEYSEKMNFVKQLQGKIMKKMKIPHHTAKQMQIHL